jgi:Family of unknown function (DUF6308)
VTILHIARMDGSPAIEIPDAELVAVAYFRLDAASREGGIDEAAGLPPRDTITEKDLHDINRTFVARSPREKWDKIIGAGELEWLRALDPGWDLIAMAETAWAAAGADDALHEALEAIDRPYLRRAVATKVLHLKRPRLVPVLDSFVVRQLGSRARDDPDGSMEVIRHLRAAGRENLAGLTDIQSFLSERGLTRTLVRILDALLWSRDPASGFASLPRLVEEIATALRRNGAGAS